MGGVAPSKIDSDGNVGHYFEEEKSWYSYFNDAGQRITVTPRVENAEGSIPAEQMMENSISHNILLIDTKVRDCQGRSQQYTHSRRLKIQQNGQ